MKTVILIRHAKSDWNDNSVPDSERPLNDRGKSDAPVMVHRLLDKKINIDAFISSPAKRAKKTASIFLEEYKENKKHLLLDPELYGADAEDFFDVISKMDAKFKNIAIFSHNPGITDFANLLTDVRVDNIPTCGVFGVKADCKKWEDFKESKKDFWFFDYPKSSS
jgi:phosphohistidine phosphatase